MCDRAILFFLVIHSAKKIIDLYLCKPKTESVRVYYCTKVLYRTSNIAFRVTFFSTFCLVQKVCFHIPFAKKRLNCSYLSQASRNAFEEVVLQFSTLYIY